MTAFPVYLITPLIKAIAIHIERKKLRKGVSWWKVGGGRERDRGEGKERGGLKE